MGADKVGIRLSPYNYFQDTRDSNPNLHWAYLCERLAELPEVNRLAYVHMVEPRFDEVLDESAKLSALVDGSADKNVESKPSLVPFRKILQKAGIKFIAAGNFNAANALPKLEGDEADAIIFGRHFLSNPDLPMRLAEGKALNPYDRSTFYGADPPSKGYIDYPFLSEVKA